MEVWEKVWVRDAEFLDSTHGQVGCVICHGGDSRADEKDPAHADLTIDPSEGDCSTCHADVAHVNELSLHTTLDGFVSAFEARGGDVAEGSPLSTVLDNHCQQCHTSCGGCHVSRPDELGGGLVSGHKIRQTPSTQYNCVACHGARVGAEYLGENVGFPADVHWTQQSMPCTECHGQELHGSGESAVNRYQNTLSTDCGECHEEIWDGVEDNPQHEQHLGDLSCQTCHSVSYKNCYGCHVSIDAVGLPSRTTEPSIMQFKIGRNPLRSGERPYEYVVLRHVPVGPDTCDYYGSNLLPEFDAVSTWKLATPHNIQLHTPQNESCDACHGNRELFLTEEDVAVEERQANKDVVVEELPETLGR